MLSKKYVVQKSFRLDAKLEQDLEYLSKKLDRPQNDLVNFALEKLMWDNRNWFIENLFVEFCAEYIDSGRDYVHCEIGGVIVDLKANNDCSTTLTFCKKDKDGNIIDKNVTKYPDTSEAEKKMMSTLRQIAIAHLDYESDEVQKVLKQRLNYR